MNNYLWPVHDCYITPQYYNGMQYAHKETGLQFYSSGALWNMGYPLGSYLNLKSKDIALVQNIFFRGQIAFKIHDTAVLYATIQNDLII